MNLKTSQISKVTKLRNAGFPLKDIVSLTGFTQEAVKWALSPERLTPAQEFERDRALEREYELVREANALLRRCPKDRSQAEHERIVRACFGV